jgi:hypothetical protein
MPEDINEGFARYCAGLKRMSETELEGLLRSTEKFTDFLRTNADSIPNFARTIEQQELMIAAIGDMLIRRKEGEPVEPLPEFDLALSPEDVQKLAEVMKPDDEYPDWDLTKLKGFRLD